MPESVPDSLTLTMTIAGTLVFVLAAIASVFYVKRKLANREREERLAEERFEKSVMRSVERKISPVSTGSAPSEKPDSRGGAPAPPSPDSSADNRMEEVIRKLEIAGLLDIREGALDLGAGRPPARLLQLRNGKTGAVFPPGTPLDLIASHSRTVDFLFAVREDGSALCCRSLSDFIADHVFPR